MTDSDRDSRNPAGRLRVTFLDVAQGDATLIRFPDGRAWLVDTGGALGRFDIGTRIVSPALWALGLRRLSTLVLTHGDRDHIGGAHAMLRDFRPGEVWEGVPVDGHAETTRLRGRGARAATHDGASCSQASVSLTSQVILRMLGASGAERDDGPPASIALVSPKLSGHGAGGQSRWR